MDEALIFHAGDGGKTSGISSKRIWKNSDPKQFRIRRETSEPSKYGLLVHLQSSRFFYLSKSAFEVLSTLVPSIQPDASVEPREPNSATLPDQTRQRLLAQSMLAELQQRPEPPQGPIVDTLHRPTHLTFEITYRCNLRCGYCSTRSPSKQGETFAFTDSALRELAQQILKAGVMSLFVSGGEPFLFSGLFPFIESLIKGGIAVTVATNGTVLPIKKLGPFLKMGSSSFLLQVKLDTMDASSFSRITGSPARLHSKVLQNISALSKLGIPFVIQSAVCPDVIEAPDELIKFATDVKAEGIRFSPIFPTGDASDGTFIPWSINALRGYQRHLEEIAAGSPMPILFPDIVRLTQSTGACRLHRTACKSLRNYIRVAADGRWIPCNVHREITLGTILRDSLESTWSCASSEGIRNRPCECPAEFRWMEK